MAINQFNDWEPVLDPVNGVMQQEPRVFAHDAVPVVIGAINFSAADGGLTISNPGTGYSVGDTLTYNAGSASGSGLVLTVSAEVGGAVTAFTVTSAGSGYLLGETLSFTGGSATFTAIVSDIDIPNTGKRGCCLYIGDAGATGTAVVKMESGNIAVFKSLPAGAFAPVLVKQVLVADGLGNSTDVADVLALY